MITAKQRIERGEAAPAQVWEVGVDGQGGRFRRPVNPRTFQKQQQADWQTAVAATRQKLGLSQSKFAELLGISLRTLHHWEQGTRKPSGAAQVLLKIAGTHPEIVLAAA
ncbi:MAG: helix-turn-helix domain-containing protein [Verrucomicrobiales bacterium]|nr:helix-turn-helix domain-containing protein [Verrucomicrobiales bacterium]